MKKFTLGLHHLNISYNAGNISSYHRQVRESIFPVIDMLFSHPHWCFSIEMSGYSIEFIASNYPSLLRRIRELIEREQIELISSTYSPQIWLAFPRQDLVKSIEINLQLLKKHELPSSRIFFSQENFYGYGVSTLSEWFDIALVKDDYYYYWNQQPEHNENLPPYYKHGDLKLLVGWGHILESVLPLLSASKQVADPFGTYLNSRFDLKMENLKKGNLVKNYSEEHQFGKFGDVEWKWFHYGSSERIGKPDIRPENINGCRFDPFWYSFIQRYLENLEEKGFKFVGISEFVHEIDSTNYEPPSAGLLIDGAWNMNSSKGGFIWMGLNASRHEDDLLVRNHNWRSRARLLATQSLVENLGAGNLGYSKAKAGLETAWKHQILAEISDSTGWFPDAGEVMFGLQQSENVLNTLAPIIDLVKLNEGLGAVLVDTKTNELKNLDMLAVMNPISGSDLPMPYFLNANGAFAFFEKTPNSWLVVANFTCTNEKECGVKFPFKYNYLEYSPALAEEICVQVPLASFENSLIYLSLPNGLIALEKDLYLIKHNEFVNIACCLDKSESTIGVIIENPHTSSIHWEFTIFSGFQKDAIDLALSINVFPQVAI